MIHENINIWNNNWQLDELDKRYSFRLKTDDLWDLLRIQYTAGDYLEKLPSILNEIIDDLQQITQFWQKIRKN